MPPNSHGVATLKKKVGRRLLDPLAPNFQQCWHIRIASLWTKHVWSTPKKKEEARLVRGKNPQGLRIRVTNQTATPRPRGSCTLAVTCKTCLMPSELKRTTTPFPLLLDSPASHSQLSCSAVPNTNPCTATSYIKEISGR